MLENEITSNQSCGPAPDIQKSGDIVISVKYLCRFRLSRTLFIWAFRCLGPYNGGRSMLLVSSETVDGGGGYWRMK